MIRTLLWAVFFTLFLALTGLGLSFGYFLWSPITPPESVVVTIPPGASLSSAARQLYARGVIGSARSFTVLAFLRDQTQSLQAGEYEFGDAARPDTVLQRLVRGDVRRYRFTIPEGLNLHEVALRVEEQGIGSAPDFLRLTKDPAFIASLGIEALTLEGYLFPETYTYTAGMAQKRLIEAMVRQFSLRLSPELVARARALGLDPHQLVTLASIIQKEAGNRAEMPTVSAVFHNRLRLKMPLQADPTVIYGVEDYAGRITRKHLNTLTPYNTYRIPGLPLGPIANPGEDALRAAAYPADVDYLYFVSRGDGTHVFSRTLREHNAAVKTYILDRRSR
jgi:UPF0755 protein